MSATSLTSLESLAAAIPDGALLAVPKDTSGVAMAATRELIRRGIQKLHLVCVPTSGLQAEMLIGTGAVDTIETSAVTMGEFGAAPCFVEAIRNGTIKVMDATCPAIYAALQAGEKGLPFIPLRGLIGTDVLRYRTDWKVIDNPFGENDPIDSGTETAISGSECPSGFSSILMCEAENSTPLSHLSVTPATPIHEGPIGL